MDREEAERIADQEGVYGVCPPEELEYTGEIHLSGNVPVETKKHPEGCDCRICFVHDLMTKRMWNRYEY